ELSHVPPHPNPLPKERGNLHLPSSDCCRFDLGHGSVAPAPWGEGSGEGERSAGISGLKVLLLTSAILWSHCCQSQPAGGVALAIGRTNTNATVSWPYPSRGFGLEFAANLGTTNWQPATGTSVSNSGRWEVTAPASQPSSFFR